MTSTTPTSHYEILGLNKDATPSEIKKAYHKKALRMHPDKAGDAPQIVAAWQECVRAHEILSDEHKRKMYDTHGESGVNMAEAFENMTPEQMLAGLRGSFPVKFQMLFFFIIIVFLFILLTQIILFCLKVDKVITGSWFLVLIPLWVQQVALFIILALLPVSQSSTTPGLKLYYIMNHLCFTAGVIWIFFALDSKNAAGSSTFLILSPVFLYWVISLLYQSIFFGEMYNQMMLNFVRDHPGVDPISKELYFLKFVSAKLVQVFLLILCSLKVDGTLGVSWALITAPIWFYYVVRIGATISATNRDGMSEEEQIKEKAKLCTSIFFYLYQAAFVILIVLKLDNPTIYNSFVMFIPLFVGFGFLMCFVCCAGTCIIGASAAKAAEEEAERARYESPSYGATDSHGYTGV